MHTYGIADRKRAREVSLRKHWLTAAFIVWLVSGVVNSVAAPEESPEIVLHVKVVDVNSSVLDRLGLERILPAPREDSVALPKLVDFLLVPAGVSLVHACQIESKYGQESSYDDMKCVQYIERSSDGQLTVRKSEKREGFRFSASPIQLKDSNIVIKYSFELNEIGKRMKVEGLESLAIGMPFFSSTEVHSDISVVLGEEYIVSAFPWHGLEGIRLVLLKLVGAD